MQKIVDKKNLLLTAALISLPNLAFASKNATNDRPNLLIILADDLGWGDLSCQYANDIQTPNIDNLFNTGVRLDNFYANSNVSSPSRAALMTGCFPQMVGVPGVIRTKPEQNWGYLDPAATTLPQRLKTVGYQTALIGKWHLGLESPNLPNEKGFDHFHGFLGDMMDDYYTHLREGHNYMYLNDTQIDPEGHATELFTEWSVDYIKRQANADSPFFLYLAYNAPHTPLQPPAEWLEKVKSRNPDIAERRALLVALIEHLDYNIGKVMKALEESGQRSNTLVIFVSDNGGDRGSMANNGPIRGAKGEMYEGGLKVPCAFNLPGRFEGGRRVGNFAMLMDIFPTLCELVGAKIENEIDGISILPSISGENQDTENRYVFWVRKEGGAGFCGKSQSAVRYGKYKLLQNSPFEEQYLFNIQDDAKEASPLEKKGPVFNKLSKALTEHYRKWGAVPFEKR